MRTRFAYIYNSAKWLLLFTVLVIAPLVLAVVGHEEESRGFWIEFGVGLGFAGLALMGLQFVQTGRSSKIGAPFGMDEILHFHGQSGYVAWLFIMGHFIILFFADPDYLRYLDPFVNLPRAVALSGVIVAVCCLIAFTHWREKIGLIYEWWRASHGLLALFVVFVGTVHIMQVSFYVTELWQQVVWVGFSLGAIGMLVYNRVIRPLQMKKKPYKVTSVKEEVEETWSIEVEPEGHEGLDFKAGQFVWITLGDTPFSMQQHPFTISSSPEVKDKIRFTMKELGDFTSEAKNIEIGSKAFVEGPYGNFTMDETSSIHNVFIVGGIGITPVMSILQTLKMRGDQRVSTVIYGTPSKDLTPFYDELKVLAAELELKVIHVFEEPDEEGEAETGLITPDLIRKHLPEDISNCEYFICGPQPMMDVAEDALREWKVPVHMVHAERFNIV